MLPARFYHYAFLNDTLLGSDHPAALGKPGPVLSHFVSTLGIRAILTLTPGYQDFRLAGLAQHHVPIRDMPSVEQVGQTVEIIHRHLSRGEPVWVHCQHGLDRTGCVIGSYLASIGQPADGVIAGLYEKFPQRRRNADDLALVAVRGNHSIVRLRFSSMTPNLLPLPQTDPTPIFEHYRGVYGNELLTAAVAHLNVFEHLASGPMSLAALRGATGLAERSAVVLLVALRAMGLIAGPWPDRLELTPIAREHLVPGGPFYVGDYVGLSADSPGVLEMARRLRTNAATPEKTSSGADTTAFTFRAGVESAMDHEASARRLTLALAGRAKNVAPAPARNVDLSSARRLLDVGGGTGIYSLALLRANPNLQTIVWDRPEVLRIAREFAEEQGLLDRVDLLPGDMFTSPVPAECDAMLVSNILHDWDVPECRALVSRLAEALPTGGRLLIHDVFLNDAMDGPLPIALYSAALFSVTEGRAYSAAEYREMMANAGLAAEPIVPTLVHCGVLGGLKSQG